MNNTFRKIFKYRIIIIVVVLLASALLYVGVKFIPKISDARVRNRDNLQTNQEMTAAYQTLVPALVPLQATVSKPGNAECTPGDPLLYAHSCGVQVQVKFRDEILRPQPVVEIVAKLEQLDTVLKKAGWEYDSNDFRSHGDTPVSTWAAMLQTYAVAIAYQKGTCYFTLNITTAMANDQYGNDYPGGVYCYVDGGPTSVYKEKY